MATNELYKSGVIREATLVDEIVQIKSIGMRLQPGTALTKRLRQRTSVSGIEIPKVGHKVAGTYYVVLEASIEADTKIKVQRGSVVLMNAAAGMPIILPNNETVFLVTIDNEIYGEVDKEHELYATIMRLYEMEHSAEV